MKETFSKRHGFLPPPKAITIREDAPRELRYFIVTAFCELSGHPFTLETAIKEVLKFRPEEKNRIYTHLNIVEHIVNCEWYQVYDIIEATISNLNQGNKEKFTTAINEFFIENGIGWKIVDGLIETRNDDVFEKTTQNVVSVLGNVKLPTAKNEIREAIVCLSRRPTSDITGAIQHSLACLECVIREATGDKKPTLGDLIKKYPNVVPPPLDKAIEKIWGFTSEQGRHLQEGRVPEYAEAKLVVELTSAIVSYLGEKFNGRCIKDRGEID